MQKAWNSIEEVPYCFSRSSVKFQGRTGQKLANFDSNWVFLECNSSLNSFMVLKWCTKLEAAYKRFATVFRGQPSNLEVTWDKKNRRFWPELSVSRLYLQFEFTDGYEMMHKTWYSIEEVPYCFSRSSIKFQAHVGWKIRWFDSYLIKTRPVAAIKSIRFALLQIKHTSKPALNIYYSLELCFLPCKVCLFC